MGVLNKLSIIKLSIIKIINYQVVSYIHILLLTANKFRWGPGGELRIVLGWYNYAYIKAGIVGNRMGCNYNPLLLNLYLYVWSIWKNTNFHTEKITQRTCIY